MSTADSLNSYQPQVVEHILRATGASAVTSVQSVQNLWSGYGQIARYHLEYSRAVSESQARSVIVKLVQPPAKENHPRGWNSDASVQRKLTSYNVETQWYLHYAKNTNASCRLPQLIGHHVDKPTDAPSLGNSSDHSGSQINWLILEDLDTHLPLRLSQLSHTDCHQCLQWLARFHALHLGSTGEHLWTTGTYWHLATRKDEYAAMPDSELKSAATMLDSRLQNCQFKTLVHGDAKVANICFSPDSRQIAMLDFQYVGKGCGMRDVAYFLGSCLSTKQCELHTDALLDVYFHELGSHVPENIKKALETEWRSLYAIAWADFHRFLVGWMPQHKKIDRYMQTMTRLALDGL